MSIFGFGKKKEETQTCCGSCTPEAMQSAESEKKEAGIMKRSPLTV